MLEALWPDVWIKSSPNCCKSCPMVTPPVFTLKVVLFYTAPKITKYLGYFWMKFCCQNLSKIAQSSHTGWKQQRLSQLCHNHCLIILLFSLLISHAIMLKNSSVAWLKEWYLSYHQKHCLLPNCFIYNLSYNVNPNQWVYRSNFKQYIHNIIFPFQVCWYIEQEMKDVSLIGN